MLLRLYLPLMVALGLAGAANSTHAAESREPINTIAELMTAVRKC
jgi:hypothetical protein